MPPYSVVGPQYEEPSLLTSGCGTIHVGVGAWNGVLENEAPTVVM